MLYPEKGDKDNLILRNSSAVINSLQRRKGGKTVRHKCSGCVEKERRPSNFSRNFRREEKGSRLKTTPNSFREKWGKGSYEIQVVSEKKERRFYVNKGKRKRDLFTSYDREKVH